VFEYHCRKHPEYREELLPAQVKARVSVEQASVFGWERYAGYRIGMKTFGASAPLKELQTKFGFTPDKIVEAAKEQLRLAREQRKDRSQ
jgi:transketolase